MTHIDLFSGIGGFALAAKWAGIQTVQFVEIDPFCQRVLRKNFPGVPIHDDIKTFTYTGRIGQTQRKEQTTGIKQRPFLITGGFPCQPFSCAGQRKGDRDDRFLWPEMLRVIKEFQPTWVIGENVAGIASMVLTDNGIEMGDNDAETQTGDRTNVLVRCITDLESIGYDVQTFCIPACSLGAPHRRDRIWIVAHSVMREYGTGRGQIREADGLQGINRPSLCSGGIERTNCHAADTSSQGLQGSKRHGTYDKRQTAYGSTTERNHSWGEPWFEVATRLCRVDDGLPRQVDRVKRLKALGNAIVPQVAFQIIKGIADNNTDRF